MTIYEKIVKPVTGYIKTIKMALMGFLKLENDGYILLENGGKIIISDSTPTKIEKPITIYNKI